ncbi:MAG: hypothetical protein QM523_08450 [Candidatus Pacebacteria bacterium]|nr:hypothetical protein [Candidatus Paceibacterota bacterium]
MSLNNVAAVATITLLVTFALMSADKLGIIHLRPAHQAEQPAVGSGQ